VDEIAMLMAYEATADLALEPVVVDTPLETTTGQRVAGKKLTLVPILRAGLGMVEGILRLVPAHGWGTSASTATTIRSSRWTTTSRSRRCAERETSCFDPMLATGGSAAARSSSLKRAGATRIKFLCLVAAPEGVARLTTRTRMSRSSAAALDRELNANGYILPGLGDAGDRSVRHALGRVGSRGLARSSATALAGLTQLTCPDPRPLVWNHEQHYVPADSAFPTRTPIIAPPGRMLINLLPDFFAALHSVDPVAAYHRYFEANRPLLVGVLAQLRHRARQRALPRRRPR
jgi:uracil phosphoribosyltransferase